MRRSSPSARYIGGVALTALLGAGALAAQESTAVAAGARVRVRSDLLRPPVLVGTLRRATPDTVVVRDRDTEIDLRLPRASITRLEVSQGAPGRGRRAIAGAAIGLFAGVVIGLQLEGGGCDDCSARENRLMELTPSLLLGSVGSFVGLLVGASTARERWTTVDPAATAPER